MGSPLSALSSPAAWPRLQRRRALLVPLVHLALPYPRLFTVASAPETALQRRASARRRQSSLSTCQVTCRGQAASRARSLLAFPRPLPRHDASAASLHRGASVASSASGGPTCEPRRTSQKGRHHPRTCLVTCARRPLHVTKPTPLHRRNRNRNRHVTKPTPLHRRNRNRHVTKPTPLQPPPPRHVPRHAPWRARRRTHHRQAAGLVGAVMGTRTMLPHPRKRRGAYVAYVRVCTSRPHARRYALRLASTCHESPQGRAPRRR